MRHRGLRERDAAGVAVATGGGNLGAPPRDLPRLLGDEARVRGAVGNRVAVGRTRGRAALNGERRRRDDARDAMVVLRARGRCGSRRRAGAAISSAKKRPTRAAVDAAHDFTDEVALRDAVVAGLPARLPPRRLFGEQTGDLVPVVEVGAFDALIPPRQAGGVRQQVADEHVVLAVLARTRASTSQPARRRRPDRGWRSTSSDRQLIVFVVENTLMIVSRCHGVVRSRSWWPPQRSTTSSPSLTTATDAPTSPFSAKFAAKASFTAAKFVGARAADVDGHGVSLIRFKMWEPQPATGTLLLAITAPQPLRRGTPT